MFFLHYVLIWITETFIPGADQFFPSAFHIPCPDPVKGIFGLSIDEVDPGLI